MSRRGRPPGYSEEAVSQTVNLEVLPDTIVSSVEPKALVKDKLPSDYFNVNAFTVVRHDKLYKLVKIPMNKENLQVGIPEVIFEGTDRWEVQSQFTFQAEENFLLVEDLK